MSHSVRSVMQRAGGFVFPRSAYAARVGLPRPSPVPAGSMALLRRMTLAHSSTIPFENIDAVMGRPISTEVPALCKKLITSNRGGYCMEHNILMLAALHDAGFTHIDLLLASVLWGSETPQYIKTHAFLLVHIPEEGAKGTPEANATSQAAGVPVKGGTRWLVDVGFGQCATQAPLRLDTTEPQLTPGGVFRIVSRQQPPTGASHTESTIYTQQVAFFPPDMIHAMSPEELLREAAKESTKWRSICSFNLRPHTAAEAEERNVFVYTNTFCACSCMCCRAYGEWHDGGALYTPRTIHAIKDNVKKVRPGLPYTFRVDTGEVVSQNKSGAVKQREVSVADTPETMYDWVNKDLGSQLSQTTCPDYHISREDFIKHIREKVVAFGGHGKSPSELAAQSPQASL